MPRQLDFNPVVLGGVVAGRYDNPQPKFVQGQRADHRRRDRAVGQSYVNFVGAQNAGHISREQIRHKAVVIAYKYLGHFAVFV